MCYIYNAKIKFMLYQLPNGKTIFLTIEEYLRMSDEDIQYYISIDYGEYIPYHTGLNTKNIEDKEYDFDNFVDDDEIEINYINNLDNSDNLLDT